MDGKNQEYGTMKDCQLGSSVDKEEASMDGVIQQGLIDMARKYAVRAKEYAHMAKNYTDFSATCSTDVLVVEDNESSSDIVQKMLEKDGLKSTVVASVEAALEYCNNNLPMIILMDIELPDGDGLKLTQTLRKMEKFRCVPIIALTAHVSSDMMMRAMEAGCDNFISKPFTRKYFVNIIHKHLSEMS